MSVSPGETFSLRAAPDVPEGHRHVALPGAGSGSGGRSEPPPA